MKKTMGFILCMTLLLSATGCGGSDEDVRGTIEEASTEAADTTEAAEETEATEAAEEETFTFGEVNSNVYENAFIGIGCNLSSDWTFYSDEEIMELNNFVVDAAGEDFAEAVEDAQVIYDMYAMYSDGMSSVNVTLENMGIAKIALLDVAESLESSMGMLEDAFTNMGYENIVTEITTVTIGGEEFDAMTVQASYADMNMYELVFAGKCGKYMWTATIGTFGEDTTQEILDTFYLVD